MYDICIIGAGPAGLTAAIYALRAGKSVIVLETANYGGQIINTSCIENYPAIESISGFEFATNLYNQALKLGMNISYDQAQNIIKNNDGFTVYSNNNSYESKAVIIASGVKKRKLNVPGEDELIGMGVSYCATCDGAFYKNKDVAVIGGGNTALDEAIFLSNYCKKVYLIHRRNEFRGEKNKIELIKSKTNITMITPANLIAINGNEKVSSIKYYHNSEEIKELLVDGLFVAIGQEPDTSCFKNLISIDNNGYIISDEKCTTNIEGIYVAGDCRTKQIRQLTTATADGTIAALAACNFIEKV